MLDRQILSRVNWPAFLQLILLAVLAWAATFGRFTLGPLQEAMAGDLDLTDTQVALLQGLAVAIPMAVGAIPMGLLIDRYPRSKIFLSLSLLNIAAVLLTAFASSFELIFLSRLLTGVVLAGCLVGAYATVGDLYAPTARGRATMTVGIGEIAAAPTAFALAGVILGLFAVAEWREALMWLCVPLLPVPFLMLLVRDRANETSRTIAGAAKPPLRAAWPTLWLYRGVVLPVLLARVMVWIADGAVLVWAAPLFARKFNLPPDQIGGIVASTFLVSGIVGPMLGGPLADFCQRIGGVRRTVAAMAVLSLISALAALFALAPTAALASVGMTIFLALGYTIGVAAMAAATVIIPSQVRGLYFAITIAGSAAFGTGLGPLAVSSTSVVLGGPAAIGTALAVVCCATSLIGAGIFMLARRYLPPEEPALQIMRASA